MTTPQNDRKEEYTSPKVLLRPLLLLLAGVGILLGVRALFTYVF